MAIQANYPASRPTLNLDFANALRLDPRLTFARGSSGTYIDAQGILRTAASGVPRFTYEPITGESLGLLIEESSVNICLYSEDLTGAGWGTTSTSVTANSAVAPDGTTTGDLLTATGGTGSVRVRSVTFTGDGEKAIAVYLKAGTATRNQVFVYDSTASAGRHYINVNWTAGVPAITTAVGAGTLFPVESVGNGWYRIAFSATGVIAANSNIVGLTPDPLVGTGNVSVWGVQVENLNIPTSYIKTEASTVTRSEDTCVMTGTAFSAWYRADEGTLVAEGRLGSAGTGATGPRPVLACLVGANVNDLIEINRNNSGDRTQAGVLINTSGSAVFIPSTFGSGTFSATQRGRVAFAYRINDCRAAASGSLSTLGTSVALPAISQLSIGARTSSASRWFNGPVARVAYYAQRLTNVQIQSITRA
jgi:hypothetical protein